MKGGDQVDADVTPSKVGLRIALAMLPAGINTFEEYADRVSDAGYKITPQALWYWRKGVVKTAPVNAFPALSKATGQTINYFYGLEPLNECPFRPWRRGAQPHSNIGDLLVGCVGGGDGRIRTAE